MLVRPDVLVAVTIDVAREERDQRIDNNHRGIHALNGSLDMMEAVWENVHPSYYKHPRATSELPSLNIH